MSYLPGQPDDRPVFLNLFQIRLPIAGVMSIIHRVTGVVMVLAIPVLVWLLETSLSSEAGFAEVSAALNSGLMMLMLFLALWGLMHHLLAGIRYLLIDIDVGVERPTYRYTAWAVMLGAPVIALVQVLLLVGGGS